MLVLAEVGELITGGPGRRLRLTRVGVEFLAAPPALQVWYLLAIWWTQVNWLIAFRLTRFGRHFLEPLVIPGRWAGE